LSAPALLTTPKLIVMTGLPGAGKSSIAEALARALRAPVFTKDWLEATILQSGHVPRDQLSSVGYPLLTALARRQLALGQSAILDSVVGPPRVRTLWRALAEEFGAAWRVVECICSDPALHRLRIEGRERGIPGWAELEWSDVEQIASVLVVWDEAERLVLDGVDPFEVNVAKAIDFVGIAADG